MSKAATTSRLTAPPSALETILSDLPPDTKAKVLQLVVDANLTDQNDILYQIVAVLGIYASYFERVPNQIADNLHAKLSALQESANQLQKISGDGHLKLQEEGVALIGALQEFVILTQSVKSETNQALEKTASHLQDLSEKFSQEIRDKVVSKTLDGLVAKVDSTLQSSEQILTRALETNRQAGEEITRTTDQLLEQSRAQLEAAHAFDSRKARRFYAVVGTLWGLALGICLGAVAWWSSQQYHQRNLVTLTEEQQFTRQKHWEEFTQDMAGNKNVLQKLAGVGIELRFVRNNGIPYLVVPGQATGETENGVFVQLPGPAQDLPTDEP
jgi:hypothetical protein